MPAVDRHPFARPACTTLLSFDVSFSGPAPVIFSYREPCIYVALVLHVPPSNVSQRRGYNRRRHPPVPLGGARALMREGGSTVATLALHPPFGIRQS